MKSEIEFVEQIESYLLGEISPKDRIAFEQRRRDDAAFDQKVVAHKNFLQQLGEYGTRKKLESQMEVIHEQLDISALKKEILPQTPIIKVLWKKYRLNAAVAASVAILMVLATLFTTGYFTKNNATNSKYSALRREIINIKKSQHAIIKNIQGEFTQPADPGHFGGTGFALSENGYVVTNYHVINGADSVFIQDNKGSSYKMKIVYIDPAYDIAVLQVDDSSFKSFGALPYTFKKSASDLGEKVYTIGFPKDDIVYGEGYLSSRSGYAGDTVAYQVSIPVNPGNSGGPLLDNKGNVIGLISGKQTQADGAAFAIKSGNLLKSISAIPQDSLMQKLVLNKKNVLAGLSRRDQIKKMENYIFMVKVY